MALSYRMNSAFLHGTLVAAQHGINQINRHAKRSSARTMRLEKYLKLQDQFLRRSKSTTSSTCEVNVELTEVDPMLPEKTPDRLPTIEIDFTKEGDQYMKLNIGGRPYVITKNTISKRQTGLLNALINVPHTERLKMTDGYFEDSGEYFIERSPAHFPVIYQYYLTGMIHQNADVCPEELMEELKYWQIPINSLREHCICVSDPTEESDGETTEESEVEGPEAKDITPIQKLRRKIWYIVEDPNSSKWAQVFAAISVLFVLISISGLVLGSIPDLQVASYRRNTTAVGVVLNYTEPPLMEPHPLLGSVESACILWFLFEYVIKLLVSYNRRKTFLNLLNTIDLLAILPFLIEIALIFAGVNTDDMQDWKGAFLVIRILRVLRVVRVLKLGRYSSGLQLFGKTLRASFRQLGMMAMVVFTGVIFFGTLMYYIEKDEVDTKFTCIPAGCWWCVLFFSSKRYGDITPTTTGGKLIATVAIAGGVLVLALPITIIVDNFMKVAESDRKVPRGGFRTIGRARISTTVEDNANKSSLVQPQIAWKSN